LSGPSPAVKAGPGFRPVVRRRRDARRTVDGPARAGDAAARIAGRMMDGPVDRVRCPSARPGPTGRPRKHSITLRGHRTSVSLEDAFWHEIRRLAEARGQSLNGLIAEIDAGRGLSSGLAAAIRVFVLQEVKAGR